MASKLPKEVNVMAIPMTKLPDEEDPETLQMLSKLKKASLTETEKKLKQAQVAETFGVSKESKTTPVRDNGTENGSKSKAKQVVHEDEDEDGLPTSVIETDYVKPDHNVSKKNKHDKLKAAVASDLAKRDEITDDNIDTTAAPLPKEIEEGNIEYKLKLKNPTPERFEHLVSQLKWRMTEGMGEAFYEIGVEDDGTPSGLSEDDLKLSLTTLEKMARELNADCSVLRVRDGMQGKVAEVLVRRYASEEFFEVRVAVVGNVDSGKSTLLGVLTRGQLDNGRGLARTNIFVHKHEIETGRTSSISHEVLGFNSKGQIVNYMGVGKNMSSTEVCEQSSKIVNFIDLAGHEKYLKTTVFGLTGHAPDFVMLMVGANMGVVGMTKEHLGISLALRVPVFVVITKIDMCPDNIMKETLSQIKKVLKSPGARKIPIVIRNEDDVIVCARNFVSERICPIFCVSNVSGQNLDLLRKFMNLLPVRTDWEELIAKPAEFHIDATWSVPGVGTVVSGTVMSGKISVNQQLLLGPDEFGKFLTVPVRSIHTKRLPVKQVKAGQSAAIALKKVQRSALRKGMAMLDPVLKPKACREFEAEVLVLYHSTTISINYQAVVHCGVAQQTAKLVQLDKEYIRTGDKSKCRFRFMYWPEYLKEGTRLIFREGRTKGIGRITRIVPKEEEIGDIAKPGKKTKRKNEDGTEEEKPVETGEKKEVEEKTEAPIKKVEHVPSTQTTPPKKEPVTTTAVPAKPQDNRDTLKKSTGKVR